MKVIVPPKNGRSWSIKATCTGFGNEGKGCGAVLEVEREDLRYYKGSDSDWGDSEPAVSFKCPCCGTVTDIGLKDYPSNYRNLTPFTTEWRDAEPEGDAA